MKTLAIGRNDPCPCGSGKKFKKCCMEKVRSTPPSHGAAEVSKGLREAMEGRQFNSLAELQAFIDRYTRQRNQRPLDEFQDLSPEQIYHLLISPFASPELVHFPEVLRTTPAAPGVHIHFMKTVFYMPSPGVLQEMSPDTIIAPNEAVRNCYTWRTLVHFAGFFGLATAEPVSEQIFCREYRVKGLPLLHDVVQFQIFR